MSEQSISIAERLERMKQALEETNGRDKPTKVIYCTKCDNYAVGRGNYLSCGLLNDESTKDHSEHHVVGDYEETSILGYIQALEWVNNSSVDTGVGQ